MHILKKPETVIFLCIILFSLFFRIKIIHDLPLGTSTTIYGLQGFDDEPAHFNYTRYLLQKQTLPVEKSSIADSNAFQLNEFEYHQPPLYYLTIAAVCSMFNISDSSSQLLTGRYFNLLLTLFSLYIIYLIFFQSGWQKEHAFFGLSFIALLGSHVYQTSLFSNDMLSWLLFWWIFYLMLAHGTKSWLSVTILLTLAHYSKTNILVIYPILIWIMYSNIKSKSEKAWQRSIVILLAPIILALPWYLRNYSLYDSFLMLSGSQWHFVSNYSESFIKLIRAPYSFLFRMHFQPPETAISIFNILQYVYVFPLLVIAIWKSLSEVKNNYILQVFLLMLITISAAYLWLAIPTGFTEGRMFFPALPVIIYFWCTQQFRFEEKHGIKGYLKYFLLIIIFIPPYCIAFY